MVFISAAIVVCRISVTLAIYLSIKRSQNISSENNLVRSLFQCVHAGNILINFIFELGWKICFPCSHTQKGREKYLNGLKNVRYI